MLLENSVQALKVFFLCYLPDNNTLIERISGHDLPVVEDLQTEGLALCVCAQVRLEPERVYRRHERLDRVQRGPGDWRVLCYVT